AARRRGLTRRLGTADAGARIGAAQTAPVSLHRIRLTVISGKPRKRSTTHELGRATAARGSGRNPQLAPPEVGRDQFLRRCLNSLSRAYGRATICQELGSIGRS